VTKVGDILEELNLQMVEQQLELSVILLEDQMQDAVLERLGAEPVYIDEAVRLAGLLASTVSSTLAMLETKGLVRQVGPMMHVKR
jgi:DNA processing protein